MRDEIRDEIRYDKFYNASELNAMEPEDAYKIVLYSKLNKKFPRGYWVYEDGLERAKIIVRYLFNDILKYSIEDIKKKASKQVFIEHKLAGMLLVLFDNSPYDAIKNAYGDEIHIWELNCVGNNYWNLDTAREATKWLIEEKLQWTSEEVKKNIRVSTFEDNGLVGMLDRVFKYSPYKALENAYTGQYTKEDLVGYKNKNKSIHI